jgi:Restriction endonuclease
MGATMSEQIEHIYNRLVAEEKLKAGTKYERLAALVFQILDRASFVIHDVELRGPGKEAEHQIDVTVSDRSGQRRRVIVEARERKKPVGLGQVRDFYGVVHQLGPDAAWIVSAAGFTADARQYARDEGIGLAVLRPAAEGEDNRVKAIHFRGFMRVMGTPTITSWLAKDDDERDRLRAAIADHEGETYSMELEAESFFDANGQRVASMRDVFNPIFAALDLELGENTGTHEFGEVKYVNLFGERGAVRGFTYRVSLSQAVHEFTVGDPSSIGELVFQTIEGIASGHRPRRLDLRPGRGSYAAPAPLLVMQQVRFVNLPSDLFGPIRVHRRRHFQVGDADAYFEWSNDEILAPLAVVEDASLTSLKKAYVRACHEWGGSPEDPTPMHITPIHPSSFDRDFVPYLPVSLKVSESSVRASVECGTQELVSTPDVVRLLQPLLDRRHVSVAKVEPIDSSIGSALHVEIDVPARGRSVKDALALGDEVDQLLTAAYATGPLRSETVAELLRTGHHDVVVGQPESDWLEAKGEPYRLDDYGRYLLATDVAAFANAGGGLLALGLKTSKRHGVDVITKADGIRVKGFNASRHHAVLRSWIFPPVVGVRVDVAPFPDDEEMGIVVIEIPPQAAELQPFFVKRTEIKGRLRTERFGVPVRLGVDTNHWDVAQLHALVVAGRAVFALRPPEHKDPEG